MRRLSQGRGFPLMLSFLLLCLNLEGCIPPSQQPKTPEEANRNRYLCLALYTLGGAATGALVAKLIEKNPGSGAAIGALGGVTLGWIACFSQFSFFRSQPRQDYQQVKQEVHYNPSQGDKVKITRFSLYPAAISPGGQLVFKAQYYVMAPEEQDLVVTETREIKFYDQKNKKYVELGKVPTRITIKPGERSGDGDIDIPEEVKEGEYAFSFIVEYKDKRSERELPMKITKNQFLLDKGNKEISVGETKTLRSRGR